MSRRFSLIVYISAILLLLATISRPARAAAIGREQAKDLRLQKSKERKPVIAGKFLACPAGLVPCIANADSVDDIYECVDVTSSLQSCGGCSLRRSELGDIDDGDGKDCTALPNVKSVECVASQCYITSCRAGFRQTSLGCV